MLKLQQYIITLLAVFYLGMPIIAHAQNGCAPIDDSKIDEHLFLYDDFEDSTFTEARWPLIQGDVATDVFDPPAPVASDTYPFPPTGTMVVTLTTNATEESTSAVFVGKCFQPVPQDGEKLFLEIDMYKDSTDFSTGTASGGTAPPVMGMGFTTGIPDIATQSLSLRITSLIEWPEVAAIAMIYTRSGQELVTDIYLSDEILPLLHEFKFDEWNHFKLIYDNETGIISVYRNGERLRTAKEFIGQEPTDYRLAFANYPYRAFFGQSYWRPDSKLIGRYDHFNSNIDVACNGEVPPELYDMTPLPCDHCELTEIVGSSVKLSSGELTQTVTPPAFSVMGSSYSPSLIYNNVSAKPSVSVQSETSVDLTTARRPDTMSYYLNVNGDQKTNIKFQSVNGSSHQSYMWDAEDQENPDKHVATGMYPYNIKATHDYDNHTLRMVSPIAGRAVVTNLEDSHTGSGWSVSGVEKLIYNEEDDSILNVIGNNRSRVYTMRGAATSTTAQGSLPDPTGMAFHAGKLYVSSGEKNGVYEVDPNNPAQGATKVAAVKDATGLTITNSGTMYVTSGSKGKLKECGITGGCKTVAKNLDSPSSVAGTPFGTVVVHNKSSGTITEVDPSEPNDEEAQKDLTYRLKESSELVVKKKQKEPDKHELLTSFKDSIGQVKLSAVDMQTGLMESRAMLPVKEISAITADEFGFTYVASATDSKILRVSDNGIVDDFADEIEEPTGMAADDQGNIFVADRKTASVYKLEMGKVWKSDPGTHSRIEKSGSGYVKITKEGTRLYFNSDGIHQYTEDTNGNRITYNNSGPDRVSSVTMPTGQTWSMEYGAGGTLSSIRDPEERITHIAHSSGVLAGIEYPDASTRTFSYSGGLMTAKTNRRGFTSSYHYDEWGRFASSTAAISAVSHAVEPADTQDLVNDIDLCEEGTLDNPAEPILEKPTSNFTNPRGFTTRYTTNRYGNMTHATNPLNHVVDVQRDEGSNPTEITMPDETIVTQEYDNMGNPLQSRLESNGATVVRTFDAQFNRPTSLTDALGNVSDFEINPDNGNLMTIKDPLENITHMEYNPRGQVDNIVNPRGFTTQFTYDPNTANPTRIDMPEGASVEYEYDTYGNVTFARDALGRQSIYEYYPNTNRVWRFKDPLGHITQYEYDQDGNMTKVTDARGAVTHYEYDPMGYVTAVVDALGNRTETTYDENHNVKQVHDAEGRVTHYVYDPLDRLVQITEPLGARTKYEYDNMGRVTVMTDPMGNRTEYDYDEAGNLYTIQPPLVSLTMFHYDLNNNLIETMHYNNSNDTMYVEKRTYDDNNRLKVLRRAVGFDEVTRETFHYDEAGNLVRTVDPEGGVVRTRYDGLNRVKRVRDELGRDTRYRYDAVGNLKKVIDANNVTTKYEYDSLNRLKVTHFPEDVDVLYDYDAVGNLISTTDGRGYSTLYSYDLLGRVEHSTDPLGFRVYYEYDDVGNLTKFTKKNGDEIVMRYDDLDRVWEKDLPGNRLMHWTYDLNSNPLSVQEDEAFRLEYDYDALDRVTAARARSLSGAATAPPAAGLTYEYDFNSNLIQMTDPTGATSTYAYDVLDRLKEMQPDLPKAPAPVLWEYDKLGRVISMTAPANMVTNYGYDAASQLLSQSTHVDGDVLLHYAYAYDLVGNRTHMIDEDGRHGYVYDDLYRLTAATHPLEVHASNPDESYAYDANHNRVSGVTGRAFATDGAPLPVAYEYDEGSRLTQDDLFYYSYDDNGNVTRRVGKRDGTTMEYDYDSEDRLTAVREWRYPWLASGTATPTVSTTYAYDPAGRRVSKNVNGVITNYAYDGHNLVAEYDADGNLLARYVHPPDAIDRPVAMVRGGQTFYYVYDGHGSVVALTNDAGQIVQRYEYDSFGRPTLVLGNLANPFMFAGREYDPETGLYFNRARTYDPDTGRFLQQDPIWDYNLYAYAGNNPVNMIDPMGMKYFQDVKDAPGKVIKKIIDKYKQGKKQNNGGGGGTSPPSNSGGGVSLTNAPAISGAILDSSSSGVSSGYDDSGDGTIITESDANKIAARGNNNTGTANTDSNDAPNNTAYNSNKLDTTCTTCPNDPSIGPLTDNEFPGFAEPNDNDGDFEALIEYTQKILASEEFAKLLDESAKLDLILPDPIPVVDECVSSAWLGLRYGDDALRLGKKGCFTEETLVLTNEGIKPIKEILEGDLVIGKSILTNQLGPFPVSDVYSYHSDHIIIIKLEDGTELQATEEHPFWTNIGWRFSKELNPGDRIMDMLDRYASVASVEFVHGDFVVYNIEVEGANTFYVSSPDGQLLFLVHNSNLTKKGVKRNPRKYWREQNKLDRLDLSPRNRRMIKQRRSPEVDDTWIKHHPEHSNYKGQKIDIHHKGGGQETQELPWGEHRGAGNYNRYHPR